MCRLIDTEYFLRKRSESKVRVKREQSEDNVRMANLGIDVEELYTEWSCEM